MGLKTLKEQFDVKHIVQRERDWETKKVNICIGSQYIHDIIIIDEDYKVFWNTRESDNPDLSRNFRDFTEASERGLLKLIIEKDDIGDTIPVWTYKNGKVIKKYCEEFGWPNLDTEGYIMHENTYFKARKEALKACRSEAKAYFGRFGVIEKLMRVWKELKFFIWYTATSVWNWIRAYIFFGC